MNAYILHLSNSTDAPARPNQIISSTVVDENKIDRFLNRYYGENKKHPYIRFKLGEIVCEEDPNALFPTAWTFDNNEKPTKVVIDLEEVKRVHMNRIRNIRNYSLKVLDQDHDIASYKNDKKELTSIKKVKSTLRGVPGEIETSVKKAKSVAEVISCVPESLSLNIPKKITSGAVRVPMTDELQEI